MYTDIVYWVVIFDLIKRQSRKRMETNDNESDQ